LELRVVFEIRIEEYSEERVVLYNDKYFTVTRVSESGDFINLTCTKRHGVFEEVRA
jgi:hypothetical protein